MAKKAKKSPFSVILLVASAALFLAFFDKIKDFFSGLIDKFSNSFKAKKSAPTILSEAAKIRRDFPGAEQTLKEFKRYNDSNGIKVFGGGVIQSHLNWAKSKPMAHHPVRIKYSQAINFNSNTAMRHARALGIIGPNQK